MLLIVVVPRVWAQPSEAETTVHVVVRTSSPSELELFERLRGQTSDLPVSLLEKPVHWSPSQSLGEQLGDAEALAAPTDADAVVWLSPGKPSTLSKDRVLLYVRRPDGTRLLMRSLDRSGTATPVANGDYPFDSAQLEVAALVVRSGLRALSMGALVGVTAAEAVAEEQASAPTSSAPTSLPEDSPPSRMDAEPPWRTPRMWLALGWQVAVDGMAPVGHHSPIVRLALAMNRFEVGVKGALGLPMQVQNDVLQLNVTRYATSAYVGYQLGGPDLRLTPAFGITALGLKHTAQGTDTSLLPLDSSMSWFAAASPELRLDYRLTQKISISLGAGIDLLPEAPRFAYTSAREGEQPDEASTVERPFRLWHLQPWFAASLGLTMP